MANYDRRHKLFRSATANTSAAESGASMNWGFEKDDRFYLFVSAAHDAMRDLNDELHYLDCSPTGSGYALTRPKLPGSRNEIRWRPSNHSRRSGQAGAPPIRTAVPLPAAKQSAGN